MASLRQGCRVRVRAVPRHWHQEDQGGAPFDTRASVSGGVFFRNVRPKGLSVSSVRVSKCAPKGHGFLSGWGVRSGSKFTPLRVVFSGGGGWASGLWVKSALEGSDGLGLDLLGAGFGDAEEGGKF